MPSCKTNINSLACFSLFGILSITEFWKIIALEYLFRCSFKFCTRGQWRPPVTVVQTPLSHVRHSFPKHLLQTNTEAARASRPGSLLKWQLTVYTVGESSALQRLVSQIPEAGVRGSHSGITQGGSSKFMAVHTGLFRDWPWVPAAGARLQALLDFYTRFPQEQKVLLNILINVNLRHPSC